MTSLFLTFTPLHLITSCGIALKQSNEDDKILLIVKDFPYTSYYIKSILNWEANPFKEIYLLNGRINLDKKSFVLRYFFNLKKIITIKKIWLKINKNNSIKLYTYNDYTIEGQYLLFKNGKKSKNIYIDDGLSSYWPSSQPYYRYHKLIFILRKIISKIIFGFWYNIPPIYGTSNNFNEMLSFYPKMVINHLKQKYGEIRKIPDNLFFSLNKTGLLNQISKSFKLQIKNSSNYCIILLANSDVFRKSNLRMYEYKNLIRRIINELENHFDIIYIKYHPREKLIGFINSNNKKLELIPNSIAVELIFLLLNPKMKSKITLIGSLSTAFITARLIIKNKLNIISIDNILKKKKLSSYYQYKKFNILIPKNFSELTSLIKEI